MTGHASHGDGQVRGMSRQQVSASDCQDCSSGFWPPFRGHRHHKWVLKEWRGWKKKTVRGAQTTDGKKKNG